MLSGLPRVGIELDTVLEPPDQHFVRVQRDPQLRAAASRGTDDALDGKGGVCRMLRRIFDDIQAERRLHTRGTHLEDPATEGARPSRRCLRAPGAFVRRDRGVEHQGGAA